MFFQNIRLLSIRTCQVDIEVYGGGMLNVQANVTDFVGRVDDGAIRKTFKDHLRPVGASERLTRHAIGQECDF